MATKRTDEFKIRALRLHLKEGKSPKEAFAQACKEYNTTPSGCMTNYATSYMWDYKEWLNKKIKESNQKVIALWIVKNK